MKVILALILLVAMLAVPMVVGTSNVPANNPVTEVIVASGLPPIFDQNGLVEVIFPIDVDTNVVFPTDVDTNVD